MKYYLDCIREEQRLGTKLTFPATAGRYALAPFAKEWGRLAGYEQTWLANTAVAGVANQGVLQGQGSQLYYGYPLVLAWDEEEGRRRAVLLPLFQVAVARHLDPRGTALSLLPEWPSVNREACAVLFGSTQEQDEVLEAIGVLDWGPDQAPVQIAEAVDRLLALGLSLPILEPLDPEKVLTGPLGHLSEPGLLNRAVFFNAEPSKFTRGLERELQGIDATPDEWLERTALAPIFADPSVVVPEWTVAPVEAKPFIEVRGLNAEQHRACRSALESRLTVVTGPPGTGKSQVVITTLANAFLSGASAVFSSRNRKAVEVVEDRLNGMVDAPILLRLGSQEGLAARLTQALTALLALPGTPADAAELAGLHEAYAKANTKRAEIEASLEVLRGVRNEIARLEVELEEVRQRYSPDELRLLAEASTGDPAPYLAASEACRAHGNRVEGLLARAIAAWKRWRAFRETERGLRTLPPVPLAGRCPDVSLTLRSVAVWAEFANKAAKACLAGLVLGSHRRALDAISAGPDEAQLVASMYDVLHDSWRTGAKILELHRKQLGSRVNGETRASAAQLRSVAQQLIGLPPSSRESWQLRRQLRDLLPSVKALMPTWAVTNLSAPGALPCNAGMFDLAVIDEASQCDIPSAIPLLFRACRAVIIGDPQQLRHITSLPPGLDTKLASRQELTSPEDRRFSFVHSALFDVAVAAREANVVSLVDHFRSHEDIVEFSNRHWYGGRLRVLTDYSRLRPPNGWEPGIRWTQVESQVVRPGSGGAVAAEEADRVVEEVVALLSDANFKGTVGVVSPFRAQANRIREQLYRRCRPQDIARLELVASTAHGLQGDERDVVIFSPCVGAPMPSGARRFLQKTENLFNVAVTRARAQLHVVGDANACLVSGIPHVEAFARHVEGLRRRAERLPEDVGIYERPLEDALRQAGFSPVPQYCVGPFRLDLAIVQDGLMIDVEVDGEHFHREIDGSRCREDLSRDLYLRQRGWTVLRFWAVEVRDRLDGCVARVRHACEASLHGGGG